MEEAQAKELIGKPILIALSAFEESTIYRAEIKQISPSGKFIEIQMEEDKPYWRRLSEKIYLLEELPEPLPRPRLGLWQPSFEPPPPPPPPPPPRVLDSSYTEPTERKSFFQFFKIR